MDANEPGLFDLPDREPPQATPEQSQRGRNRETWALTATADVTIIDAAALHETAARADENAVTIGMHADPVAEDSGSSSPDVERVIDAFDPLAWLIWPTDGLDAPLQADAFRLVSVESEVVAESVDRGKVSWKVTVKLTDVNELRRLAVRAHPDEAAAISDSLAIAWQRAADPFAPLRTIPGISWRPGQVNVEHVRPRTAARTR